MPNDDEDVQGEAPGGGPPQGEPNGPGGTNGHGAGAPAEAVGGGRTDRGGERERERDRDKDDETRGLRDRLEGLVPEIVRKTFYAGLGALFTTEEGIRKITSEMPKDVGNYLLNQADGAKDEILRVVGREMHEFLERLNLSQELAKLLTQLSFEIKTEIRFIPNDQAVDGGLAVKPDIKRKVALKRHKDRDSGSVEPDDPDAD